MSIGTFAILSQEQKLQLTEVQNGQWIDNLQLVNDRTGPSVRDDEWQRILIASDGVSLQVLVL